MSAEFNNSFMFYGPDPYGRQFEIRPLRKEDTGALENLRVEDFTRRLIEPGYLTQKGMYDYIDLLDKNGGLFAPADIRVIGLFERDETNHADLVGFRSFGPSTYPDDEVTTELLEKYSRPGKNNETPAYIDFSCLAAAGRGYGRILRHAGATMMIEADFVVVGRKIMEFEWPGHVEQNKKLGSRLLRRSNAGLELPAKGVKVPTALHRTEVYVPLSRLIEYLEGGHPWLADYEVIKGTP